MKRFIKTVSAILGISVATQPAIAAQFKDPPINFTNYCIGRYQIDLPTDMRQVESYYYNNTISLRTYAPDNPDDRGVLRGEQRVKQWQNYVESQRQKYSDSGPQYIIEDLVPPVKTLAFYSVEPIWHNPSNNNYVFDTFFFKDYPEHELGIFIADAISAFIPQNKSDYIDIYHSRLANRKQAIEQVNYLPWPHNQPGVCLDGEFSVVYDNANMDESYYMVFYNGKNSRLTFRTSVFGGEGATNSELQKLIKEDLGPLSIFASSNVNIAGRKGRLFVSDDRYSETGRRFVGFQPMIKWIVFAMPD